MRKASNIAWAGALAALLFATSAVPASAALPAPNFMPGFPLVAGPQVIFMWSPVMGAEKYRIYQNGKSVAEVAAFQHVMPLPTGGEHAFHVVAVDKEGKESPPGKTFNYSVLKLEVPKNVSVLVRDNRIAVRWDPVKGALVYDVHKSEAPAGPFQLIGSTQDLTFLDTNIKPGVAYYYRVASKDATGTSSEQSAPVVGKIEVAAEKPAEKKLKIVKTRLEWESKDIENVTEAIYLPNGDLVAVTPISFSGSYLVIIKDAGSPKEVRTVVTPPESGEKSDKPDKEEAAKARFGGIGLSANGSVWVTSNLTPQIFRLDPASGKIVETLDVAPIPKTETPYSFNDVAEGPDGALYVVEQKNTRVMVVRKGKIVSTFGTKGVKPGEFAAPGFVLVEGNEVLVTDAVNGNITVFGVDGKYLRRMGEMGGRDPGTFSRLTGIAVDPKKKWIFAGDRATSNIQVLDFEGKFVAMLSNENGTGAPGTNPVGLDVRDEALLVSWQNANKIQEYRLLGPPAER